MDLLVEEYGSDETSDDGEDSNNNNSSSNNNEEGTANTAVLNETPDHPSPLSSSLITIVPSRQANKGTFVRTVPHIPGKWSGHVFAPLPAFIVDNDEGHQAVTDSLVRFQRYLQQIGFPGKQVVSHMDNCPIHLSLSRHFALQLSSIESFVERLQNRLSLLPATTLCVKVPPVEKVLVNDDRTRSFWTWPIESNPVLLVIVEEINAVLKMYNQPPYYKPPLFHISLASVVGDIGLHDKSTAKSNTRLFPPTSSDNDVRFIPMKEIYCTLGTTKKYKIRLQN